MIISFTTWVLGWYDFQFWKLTILLIFELFNKVLFDGQQFAQLENLNWNSSQLLQEDHITANWYFELFNKSLDYLKIVVLDNFVYLILCHETIRDFEIENYYSSHFLKPNSCVPPQRPPSRLITALAFVLAKEAKSKSCKVWVLAKLNMNPFFEKGSYLTIR
jgi:hypothetical protein